MPQKAAEAAQRNTGLAGPPSVFLAALAALRMLLRTESAVPQKEW